MTADPHLTALLEQIVTDQYETKLKINELLGDRAVFIAIVQSLARALEQKGVLSRDDFAVVIQNAIDGLKRGGASDQVLKYARAFQSTLLRPAPGQKPSTSN